MSLVSEFEKQELVSVDQILPPSSITEATAPVDPQESEYVELEDDEDDEYWKHPQRHHILKILNRKSTKKKDASEPWTRSELLGLQKAHRLAQKTGCRIDNLISLFVPERTKIAAQSKLSSIAFKKFREDSKTSTAVNLVESTIKRSEKVGNAGKIVKKEKKLTLFKEPKTPPTFKFVKKELNIPILKSEAKVMKPSSPKKEPQLKLQPVQTQVRPPPQSQSQLAHTQPQADSQVQQQTQQADSQVRQPLQPQLQFQAHQTLLPPPPQLSSSLPPTKKVSRKATKVLRIPDAQNPKLQKSDSDAIPNPSGSTNGDKIKDLKLENKSS